VRRADNLTTFMCRLSRNSGASNSWNPQGPVQACSGKALLFFLLPVSATYYFFKKHTSSKYLSIQIFCKNLTSEWPYTGENCEIKYIYSKQYSCTDRSLLYFLHTLVMKRVEPCCNWSRHRATKQEVPNSTSYWVPILLSAFSSPGLHSVSTRNEHQAVSLGVKCDRRVELTALSSKLCRMSK
jgi:hypothetical protein